MQEHRFRLLVLCQGQAGIDDGRRQGARFNSDKNLSESHVSFLPDNVDSRLRSRLFILLAQTVFRFLDRRQAFQGHQDSGAVRPVSS
jgi:hypothetical protein